MTGHLGSIAGLTGFVLGMGVLVTVIQRTGRPRLPVAGLWGLLVFGYFLTGARFVQTMDIVGWVDGLTGFIALCGALPVAALIRRLCPSCHRGLNLTEDVVRKPSRQCPGVGATSWCCPHCGHHEVRSHTIPCLAEMASEAVPWSPEETPETGHFGASYAAGAGGGASWELADGSGSTDVFASSSATSSRGS